MADFITCIPFVNTQSLDTQSIDIILYSITLYVFTFNEIRLPGSDFLNFSYFGLQKCID